MDAAGPSLHALVIAAARRLEDAGIARGEAERDAALLARHVLGWDMARWLVERRESVPDGFALAFLPLIERRTTREPIAYLLGRCEFWGLEFEVTPAVLIPRPETELLVEEALRLAGTEGAPGHVVDVGTGSGCLAIALARAWTAARVTATDVSAAALAVARRNGARHGVAGRIDFVEGALLAGTGGVDLVVSNPPYISPADRAALQPEVRDFEPHAALFAEDEGLAVIDALAREAVAALTPGGWFLCEIGYRQWTEVARRLGGDPRWAEFGVAHDLQGIPRTVRARRRGTADP